MSERAPPVATHHNTKGNNIKATRYFLIVLVITQFGCTEKSSTSPSNKLALTDPELAQFHGGEIFSINIPSDIPENSYLCLSYENSGIQGELHDLVRCVPNDQVRILIQEIDSSRIQVGVKSRANCCFLTSQLINELKGRDQWNRNLQTLITLDHPAVLLSSQSDTFRGTQLIVSIESLETIYPGRWKDFLGEE